MTNTGKEEERIQHFLEMLSSTEWDLRYRAAQELGRLGDPKALNLLIQALQDADWRVRQKAAWALGNIGDPRAIQPLRRLMTDPSDGVQDMIRQALDMIRRKMYS
ncbi:MAG: HEAT repeat domain-containing protein [Methanomicrobiales archaeon]|nr:HEAT repeat domain-containing protein [Methanomicrobiales archaeon]